MGGSTFGLVFLGSIKEQAEQARGSKPVRNIPPWPLHQLLLPELLEFQSSLPFALPLQRGSVSSINPFLTNLLRVDDACAGRETLTKTPNNGSRYGFNFVEQNLNPVTKW